MEYWYAWQVDENDNDWGSGSYDKDEAIRKAKERNYKRIAVIEEGNDPTCIEELINGEDF